MADLELYTGTHGFELRLETGLDLSSAREVKLRIKTPRGNTITRPVIASQVTDDGVVKYIVQQADFNVPGLYRLQVSDETGGKRVYSPIQKVRVRASVEYMGS